VRPTCARKKKRKSRNSWKKRRLKLQKTKILKEKVRKVRKIMMRATAVAMITRRKRKR
jgi:hypothetical protein